MNELNKIESQIKSREPELLNIVERPSETLKQTSVIVIPEVSISSSELAYLLNDMVKTLQAYRGIGLAAIQVGMPLDIFVVQDTDLKPRVMINANITKISKEKSSFHEGCLSIPGFYKLLYRPKSLVVKYLDENFMQQELKAEGLLARTIQHEVDHCNGLLFIDRFHPIYRKEINDEISRIKRKIVSPTSKINQPPRINKLHSRKD